MQRLRKYTATVLCLVLIVPFVYQSAHILVGHEDAHHASATFDFVYHEAEDNADCPICEYEFASYCVDTNIENLKSGADLATLETPFKEEHIHSYSGIDISLRAPPQQG